MAMQIRFQAFTAIDRDKPSLRVAAGKSCPIGNDNAGGAACGVESFTHHVPTAMAKGHDVNRTIAGMDSRDLVARCNLGDRAAWAEFHSRYVGLITAAVGKYRSATNPEIEDVIQEVFLHLIKALRHYDPTRPLEVYILEIARRVGISRYRQLSAQKRGGLSKQTHPLDAHDGGDEAGYISVASPDVDQESALLRAQEIYMLRKALVALTESCRKLLSLRYDRGLSYKEISVTLGEKEASLRVKTQRCLSALSKQYSMVSVQEVLK